MAVTRWEDVAALLIGGIAGSMAGALLVRAGVRPDHAAAAMTAGGVALALASSGGTRLAGAGAAAAGTGQLAMAWMERERELAAMRNADGSGSAMSPEARHRISRALDRAFGMDRRDAVLAESGEEAPLAADLADVDELGDRDDVFGSDDGPTGVRASGVRIPDGDEPCGS